MTNDSIFDRLPAQLAQFGPSAALKELADYLLAERQFHELFEARKMQLREQLSLPLVASDAEDQVSDETRDRLENGLIDACQEVGLLLLRDGRVRDAWHYLRAVGDRSLVRQELDRLQPTDENTDEFLELLVHEGLDLHRGFELMLSHYGTCNSITTFDSAMYGHPRNQRAIGAAILVRHLYAELLTNVQDHIGRHDGKSPADGSLAELMADRPWLFENGTYHVDTTHLASIVRFARDVDDPDLLRLGLELALYGQHLDPSLQYQGDEPFEDLYPTSGRYFSALLNEDADSHIDYFRQRAEAVDPREDTTLAIETYVDLLARLGQNQQALEESMRLLPEGVQQTGRAPSLFELAEAAQDFSALEDLTRRRGDAVGFAVSLLRRSDT